MIESCIFYLITSVTFYLCIAFSPQGAQEKEWEQVHVGTISFALSFHQYASMGKGLGRQRPVGPAKCTDAAFPNLPRYKLRELRPHQSHSVCFSIAEPCLCTHTWEQVLTYW